MMGDDGLGMSYMDTPTARRVRPNRAFFAHAPIGGYRLREVTCEADSYFIIDYIVYEAAG